MRGWPRRAGSRPCDSARNLRPGAAGRIAAPGGPPASPAARPRRGPFAAALSALALLAALLAAAGPAQAQTTLVSNRGEAEGGSLQYGEFATKFTTGANATGYTLSTVELPLRQTVGRSTAVAIRQGTGTNPGVLVATLTNPSSLTSNAVNTFTAPANTTLAANTTYFLVFNDGLTDSVINNVSFRATASHAQTGLTGWSIANSSRFGDGSNSWIASLTLSLRFALNGAVNGPPAPTGLTADPGPGSGQVTLNWDDPGNSAINRWQWDNWRGTPGAWGGWRNMGGGGNRTTFTATGLNNGTQYGFRIRAWAGGRAGLASDAATATPVANPPPAKPTGFTAAAGDGVVTLSWTNPGNSAITQWQWRQRTSGGAWGSWGGISGGGGAISVALSVKAART